ncbi:MAG: hypothetical protein ABIO57_03095 [Candidatus Paceibacterota bacterium]
MENNKIKPISLIITGVVLVAFIALFVSAKKHQQQAATVATQPDVTTSAPASLCFVLNKKTNSTSNDVAYLKLTTSDGGQNITGELGTYLAEKDGKKGTLSGSASADKDGNAIFDGQYANSAEGMNNIDEQLIKIDGTQAIVGYGEMQQAKDGTYDYKDKAKVTYSLAIPTVDCAQYDALKTAAGH